MISRIAKHIPKIVAALVVLAYGAASYMVWRTDVLPAKYLWLCLAVAGLVAAGICYVCLRRWPKGWLRRSLLLLLALLYTAGGAYTAVLARTADNVFWSTQQQQGSYITYSLVGSSARPTQALSEVGYMQDDQYASKAFDALALQPDPKRTGAPELSSLLVSVADEVMPAAVVRTAQLKVVEDNNPDLFRRLRVISQVKVLVPQQDSVSINLDKPFVVYISGIDTYGSISTVSRSDVNMLAAVNPLTHKIVLVNTPRDYYVQLHGTTGTRDKLTHAGIYGIDMSRQTLEDLYGVQVDQYVRINFSSLTSTIDALGGVDVQSAYDFKVGRYHYTVGSNHLDGAAALAFARERHSFAAGDRVRGENQQRVIEAVIAKLSNPRDLISFQRVLGSLEGTLQTNVSQDSITALIRWQLNSMHPWSVQSLAVDGVGASKPTYSMGSQRLYVMEPNMDTVAAASAAMKQVLEER